MRRGAGGTVEAGRKWGQVRLARKNTHFVESHWGCVREAERGRLGHGAESRAGDDAGVLCRVCAESGKKH